MDNDELLIAIKGMFDEVKSEVKEVKNHMGVIAEGLKGDIKAIAEGHDVLNRKIDFLDKKIDDKTNELKTGIKNVANYVIGVDAKLNEHEIILKKVK